MNENTTTSRLETLSGPLRMWRGLGGVEKYALYTRVSFQLLPLTAALGFVTGVLINVTGVPWIQLLVGTIFFFAVLGLSFAVFEFHPSLNTKPRRDVTPFFRAGLGLTFAGLIASLVLQYHQFPIDVRNSAVAVSIFCLVILSVSYIPWLRFRWLIVIALTILVGGIVQLSAPHSYILWTSPALIVLTVRLSLWTVDVMKEVERSRELEASLRVTEERLRFSQELHDTLGQHLAAMSVKSELALALAKRGDSRLEGELVELQKLTRTSMSEMREVVQGYRAINLATEIEGAKSLLNDARIALSIHGDSFDVLEPHRELAAWLIREATTNVLRHSSATAVDLYLTAGEVQMRNNGAHEGMGKLSGLGALRQRAKTSGVALLVERDGQNFSVKLINKSAQ